MGWIMTIHDQSQCIAFSRVSSAFPLRHLRPSLCKLCISLNPVEFAPVWAQVFTANTAAQAWQLWDSLQLPWIEMVINRACALQKSEAAKLYQFSPGDPGLSWGRSGFSHCWFDISGSLASYSTAQESQLWVSHQLPWIEIVQFRASHHAVLVLRILGGSLQCCHFQRCHCWSRKSKVP